MAATPIFSIMKSKRVNENVLFAIFLIPNVQELNMLSTCLCCTYKNELFFAIIAVHREQIEYSFLIYRQKMKITKGDFKFSTCCDK